MVSTTRPLTVPAVLLLAVTAAGPALSKDTLSVIADAPVVPLSLRGPGRNFVRLPTLEYTFEIQTQCTESRSPRSLSLNVADTRKWLAADEIVIDGPTEIRLRIPASQIAPLVIEDFCVVPGAEDGEGNSDPTAQITIPAALSAQASLLCEGDEDKVMTYVSRPLDISLVCERAPSDEEPP